MISKETAAAEAEVLENYKEDIFQLKQKRKKLLKQLEKAENDLDFVLTFIRQRNRKQDDLKTITSTESKTSLHKKFPVVENAFGKVVSPIRRRVLYFISTAKEPVTTKEVSAFLIEEGFTLSNAQVSQMLTRLRQGKFIERIGGPNKGKWQYIKPADLQ